MAARELIVNADEFGLTEGVGTSPILANVSGDAKLESALTAFLGDATIYNANGSTFSTMQGGPFGTTGAGSDT